MVRQRLRIRFRKEGPLRLISHRDLARLCERMFRRAQLPLAMSEGFHPKARMSFPSALGLGIAGQQEVLEVQLAAELPVEEVERRLRAESPPGFTVTELQWIAPGTAKAQVARATYEMPIPAELHEQVRAAIQTLWQDPTRQLARPDRPAAVDVHRHLETLQLCDDRLLITLRHSHEATVRPRDLLVALGLSDLESRGYYLTRTQVEVAS